MQNIRGPNRIVVIIVVILIAVVILRYAGIYAGIF